MYLRECILHEWENAKDPSKEVEAFQILRVYFKSPSAEILIKYDPQINEIYRITDRYFTALALYKQGVADSSEAVRLEEENPEAEGEIAYFYKSAEEKLTEAEQILSEIGVRGKLYWAVKTALKNIPQAEVQR